jgi:hypothetical protein
MNIKLAIAHDHECNVLSRSQKRHGSSAGSPPASLSAPTHRQLLYDVVGPAELGSETNRLLSSEQITHQALFGSRHPSGLLQ